ncbi:hypothetical protein VTL71DRAFT_10897 [Oculimacula yallundae]|uniref:Uncharacterized protein n=1 Tax=Oculimacula yallundae TaxID=86028 RepID=A0ABR4CUD8_9HELO
MPLSTCMHRLHVIQPSDSRSSKEKRATGSTRSLIQCGRKQLEVPNHVCVTHRSSHEDCDHIKQKINARVRILGSPSQPVSDGDIE